MTTYVERALIAASITERLEAERTSPLQHADGQPIACGAGCGRLATISRWNGYFCRACDAAVTPEARTSA